MPRTELDLSAETVFLSQIPEGKSATVPTSEDQFNKLAWRYRTAAKRMEPPRRAEVFYMGSTALISLRPFAEKARAVQTNITKEVTVGPIFKSEESYIEIQPPFVETPDDIDHTESTMTSNILSRNRLRLTIKEQRSFKKDYNDIKIGLGGSNSKGLEEIYKQTDDLILSLREKYGSYISPKLQALGNYLGESSGQNIEEVFDRGLRTALKLRYRFLIRQGERNSERIFNDNYIEDLALGYFFDFFRSLNISRRRGVAPQSALEIARKSYNTNPNLPLLLDKEFGDKFEHYAINHALTAYLEPREFLQKSASLLPHLLEEFEDEFEDGLITRVVITRPKDPRQFLINTLKSIQVLRVEFPDLPNYLIAMAAIERLDPKEYLAHTIETVKHLQEEFSDLPSYVITYTVTHNSNPRERILEIKQQIKLLGELFRDLSTSTIIHGVISYTNPREFLDRVKLFVTELQKEFGEEFNASILERVAIRHSNPQGFLQKTREVVRKLQEKFLDLPNRIIIQASVDTPNNPEAFLQKVQEILPNLLEEFGDRFAPSEIRYAVFQNPSKAREFLNKSRESIVKLAEEFSEFPLSIIKYAIFEYSDPQEFLRKTQRLIPELQQAFPEFNPSTLLYLSTNKPKDPAEFLANSQKLITELRDEFPELGSYIIRTAVIHHPRNPRVFLTRVKKTTRELENQFPEFPSSIITKIALDYSKPQDFLNKFKQVLSVFEEKYPEIGKNRLIYILFHYRNNPESVIDKTIQ